MLDTNFNWPPKLPDNNCKNIFVIMERDHLIICFWGAAETVTCSKCLIEAIGKKIMVDCGLYLGIKKWRNLIWEFNND